ncbi:hypothetical protein KKH3_06830 [Pectobacterium actinidiae]|nr:hypothetical protein KKH3_06830 [Pectobacterium actinidiae]
MWAFCFFGSFQFLITHFLQARMSEQGNSRGAETKQPI